jgi:spermidine/putrescine transport system substrate-binding protein
MTDLNDRARLALALGAVLALAVLAGCGSDDGGSDSSGGSAEPAPVDLAEPATGTLRVFAYGDTVPDKMLDPFRAENPDLDLKIATFNSNKAAAAKLAGGFQADVVEVCTDEMEPLTARGLLQPIDPAAIADFDQLAFAQRDEVRDADGNVLFAPASAGPHGLIVNTDEVTGEIDSYQDLFDPAYAGRAALESAPLTAIGVGALALGMDDPMNLTPEQVDEVEQYLLDNRDNFRSFPESDSDLVNLFKSGEVVIADGGRGTTQDMVDDGLPVEWIAPKEGALSWVCGLGLTADAENLQAAYRLIDYYTSPEAQAISASLGFVAMNPDAIPMVPAEFKDTADPSNLKTSIPQTQPEAADAYDRAWQEVAAG